MCFVLGAVAGGVMPAHAQEGAVVVEAGAARALPPSGVVDGGATYGMGGVRVEWAGPRGALIAGAYGGRAADDAGSDFISGALGGEFWLGPGSPVGLGLGATVQAFAVDEPLLYRVSAAELSPMVRVGGGATQLVVRGSFGVGTTRVELHRRDGAVRRAERDLESRGVDAELRWASSRLAVMGVVGVHTSRAGDFCRGGVQLIAEAGPVTLRADGGRWATPSGGETVGSVSLSIPIGRLEARVSGGRTAPGPLTLVEAGTQTSVLVGFRIASLGGGSDLTTVHELVRAGRPSWVRIRVDPGDADRVEVMGDFGDWVPVPLVRDGSSWSVELPVEPGLHHFGFLVDGEWWIPEGLQGTVPDEWGRMNATMVVPDQEQEP